MQSVEDMSPTIQAYNEVYRPNNPVTADNFWHPSMFMPAVAELAPSIADIYILGGAGKALKGVAKAAGKKTTLSANKLKNAYVEGIMSKQKKNAKKNSAAIVMSKQEVEDMVTPLVQGHSLIPITMLEAGSAYTSARDQFIEDGWTETDAQIGAATVASLYAPISGYLERAQLNTITRRLRWPSGKLENTVMRRMAASIFGKQKYTPGVISKIGIGGLDLSADVISSSWQEGMQALTEEIVNDAVKQGYGVDGDSAIRNLTAELGELGLLDLDPWGFINTDVREEVSQSAYSALTGTAVFSFIGLGAGTVRQRNEAKYQRRQVFKDVHERGNDMKPYISETKDGQWSVDFSEIDSDGNIVDRVGEQKVFSTKKKAENFANNMVKQFGRMANWSREDIANAYDRDQANVKPEEEVTPTPEGPVEPVEAGTSQSFVQDLANEMQGQQIITADKTYEDKEIESIKGLPLGQKIVSYFDNAKDPAIFQKLENDGVINQDQRESMEAAVIAEGRQVLSKKLKPPRKKITKEDNTRIDEFVNERLEEGKILQYMAGQADAVSDINIAAQNFGIDQKIEERIERKVASVEEQRIIAAEEQRIEAQTAKATPVGATKTYTRAELGKMTNTQLNKVSKAMNLNIDPKFISKTPDLARDIIFEAQPKLDTKPKKKGVKIQVKAPKVGQEQDIVDQIEEEAVIPKAPAVSPAILAKRQKAHDKFMARVKNESLDQLREIARVNDIPGYKTMSKKQVLEALDAREPSPLPEEIFEGMKATAQDMVTIPGTFETEGKPVRMTRIEAEQRLKDLEESAAVTGEEGVEDQMFVQDEIRALKEGLEAQVEAPVKTEYEDDMVADKPAAAIEKAAKNIIPEGATELDPSDIVSTSKKKEGEKIKIQTQSSKAAETVEDIIDDCAGGDF